MALGIRLVRLSDPEGLMFDETYYAKDACLYIGEDPRFCGLEQSTEQSYVHPPMGKWLIAAGIKTFGYNEFGWRISSAIFGTFLVLLVFLLARKLFRDRWVAGAAAFLVATDFLMIVQSRIAMLDIFQAFFVVLGFLFLAHDRERVQIQHEHLRLAFPGDPPPREFEWRISAGVAFGMAVAVKWSAAWALAAAAILAAVWSLGLIADRVKKARQSTLKVGGAGAELAVLFLSMILIPGLIYLTSYSLYFSDSLSSNCPYKEKNGECVTGASGAAKSFLSLQDRMIDYHLTLRVKHAYQSDALTWPVVKRPVAYFYEGEPKSRHVMAVGNPAVWWPAMAAGVWLLIRSRKSFAPERVVVLGWIAQYVPWILVQRPLFFFYMTPVVPFMMIGLAVALGALAERAKWLRVAAIVYLVTAGVLMLTYMYPVIAAVGLEYGQWNNRMLMKSWI
ncbi:MAG TPA: phospholipid carrier-dependent glycosyltransferase [Actinomycetota bacterium]|nr:phospholipid carrier-dependent glycosyltransferase [Actinomycetota bacterium]